MIENELPTPSPLPHGVYVFFQLFNVRSYCSSISAGSCAYSYANKAFIFSLYNVKGYNPVKLTQYQNQQYAMYRCNTYGPTFGNDHDIYTSDDFGNNQNSYTRCGSTYTAPSGYSTGDCGFFYRAFFYSIYIPALDQQWVKSNKTSLKCRTDSKSISRGLFL